MSKSTVGPERLVRLAYIARRHYLEGRTRIEIAEELGMSRIKVGRMLDDAIASGIVTFNIAAPDGLDVERSLALQRKYGLKHSVVVHTPTEASETIQRELGRAAGDLLAEIATAEDVIGMTAGRTLSSMSQQLRELPASEVVQLAGIAGPVQATGVEVIRRVSSVSGGRAWTIYAPIITSDAAAAEAITRQHEVRQTYAQFARVSIALVAIGSWAPPDSQLYDNPALSSSERRAVLDAGAAADIGAILIDRSGKVMDVLPGRSVAIDEPGLRRIPEVIGVAGGTNKTKAVASALASGLISSLVTDSALAGRLLEENP
ncbi:DNA-binding transcriptional regulator [Sinomonas cellulolyticus]|uniref:Transcriptional regulator n=1 Tax=Sinomonas cellulolyticus TaxID=2801916 RepID=A0ABS1K5I3_9MICC|nr:MULTISPECIES: sugar-binding domain-containing protein [Sinomonas]MBL0706941.1 transcriptional regulator [Sinomonas cellulolyticus]GHG59860.1 DNA-binding transcriptional regulator [Sinomonas sp. KCTC 49339]